MYLRNSTTLCISSLKCRRVVQIHAHAAEVRGALVLLGVGGGPAGEGDEVSECGVSVVVRIPERQLGAVGVGQVAEDAGPLGGRGVHPASHPVVLARIHQLLVPEPVGVGVARPVLGALDVQPHAARPGLLAVRIQVVQQRAHLLVRADRARGAWEDVSVSGLHARGISTGEGVAHSVVDRAVATVAAGNHEGLLVGYEAAGNVRRHVGAHVHAVLSGGGDRWNGRRTTHAALKVSRAGAVAGVSCTGAEGGLKTGAGSERSRAAVVGAALNIRRTGTQTCRDGTTRATTAGYTDADTFDIIHSTSTLPMY
eukprot:Colp12_sorted_trinity150504_noHs@31448